MNCGDQCRSYKGVSHQYYRLQRRLISTRKLRLCPVAHKRLSCDACKSHFLSRTVLVLPPVTIAGARRIYRQIRVSTTCFTSQPSAVLLSKHMSVCRVQERQLPELESATVSKSFQCCLQLLLYWHVTQILNTCAKLMLTKAECFCFSLCTLAVTQHPITCCSAGPQYASAGRSGSMQGD